MLHDLYLLSCYFEGPQAVLYEDDLKRRYGMSAVADALQEGLIELYCAPCVHEKNKGGRGTFFCRLSQRGVGRVESALA